MKLQVDVNVKDADDANDVLAFISENVQHGVKIGSVWDEADQIVGRFELLGDPMPDTTYIVLHRFEGASDYGKPVWAIVDPAVPAASAEAAIRATAQDGGVYVAVPGRSFRPVQVQSVQTTTLKLEAAE